MFSSDQLGGMACSHFATAPWRIAPHEQKTILRSAVGKSKIQICSWSTHVRGGVAAGGGKQSIISACQGINKIGIKSRK